MGWCEAEGGPLRERELRSEGVEMKASWVFGFMAAVLTSACGGGDGNGDGSLSGESMGAGGGAGAAAGGAAAGGVAGAMGGEAGAGAASGCARFVTGVLTHHFGDGQNTGQNRFPEVIYGPPEGGGCCTGSLDVVSLGNGGTISVEFGESEIVDGPGIDFTVFENAFYAGGDPDQVFAELATVEVSADGETWHAFRCDAVAAPYGSCAGWHPVYANATSGNVDPLDPQVSGGDGFDLAEVGLERARYVRITDREDLVGAAGVFDLDAVGIINVECP